MLFSARKELLPGSFVFEQRCSARDGLPTIGLRKQLLRLLALLLCTFYSGLSADVSVRALVEPNPITLGQSGQFKIIVEGSKKAEPPDMGNDQNLEFAYRGPNTQISWVNGQMNATITHIYQVRPLRIGKYRILPQTMFIDGKNYQTNEVILEIVEQTASSTNVGKIAYLEFDLPERNIYLGETIASELRMILLNQANFPNKGVPQTEGDAFSVTPIDQQPQITRQVSEGRYYDVYIWKIGITPVKTGVQDLQFKATHTQRIPEGNTSSRRDPFSVFRNDPFFDNMFGRYQDRQIQALSQPAEITIEPVPEAGRPDSFNGAIGNFEIAASTNSTDLVEGDPITLKIAIRGDGNFSQMIPPEFPEDESFKTYPPRVVDEQLDKQGYSGFMQFEYVIIPTSADIRTIPPIPFSFFHPETGSYSRMDTPPIPISIKATVQPVVGKQISNFTNSNLNFQRGNDNQEMLLPIKISLGSTMATPTLDRVQNILAMSVVAPLGILGIAYIIRRSRQSSQNDKERIRLKKLDQKMEAHREEMKSACDRRDPHAFYQAACRVLQVALARQLGCYPESITGKEINALWVPSLGDDQIKSSIQEFFQKVDALRYSGGESQFVPLEKEELELESILRQLGKKK